MSRARQQVVTNSTSSSDDRQASDGVSADGAPMCFFGEYPGDEEP